jgi:hypothetical protein
MANDPIEVEVINVLTHLGETEDIEDAASRTWPAGEDDYFEHAGEPAAVAHNERTWAAIMRKVAAQLVESADAADARAAANG